jgi:hypothetical protein
MDYKFEKSTKLIWQILNSNEPDVKKWAAQLSIISCSSDSGECLGSGLEVRLALVPSFSGGWGCGVGCSQRGKVWAAEEVTLLMKEEVGNKLIFLEDISINSEIN